MTTILRRMLWITALVAVASFGSWRLTLVAGQRPDKGVDVQLVAPGQPVGGHAGQKGATYYALESRTSRLVTVFLDGTKAVADRGADGDVVTKLEDGSGNDINRVRIDRNDGVHDTLQYLRPTGDVLQALVDSAVHPTLDWSNRQSHRLYQDGVGPGARLQWNGGLMRRAGSSAKEEEHDVVRTVETQWADGLSAKTIRLRSTRGQTFDGRPVQGDVLVTTLMRDGLQIGVANYLTFERIYAWSIPGVTDGAVTNDHLKPRHGGWPFTPDMVWMNLQAIGLYHWKTVIDRKGFVARQRPQPAGNPILRFFAPTVSANESGCDNLHWLDGTVIRYCCDVHDFCYETFGCSSSTWWRWGGWSCSFCNVGAVFCFAGGGSVHGPFTAFP